ncbi:MAG: PQQ-binding-like beta-propeller repeat protein [Pirellulaceae bacterium]
MRLSTRFKRASLPALILAVWWTAIASISADDWPQILGPDRNGRAAGEDLLATWPTEGPKLRWKRELGSGFSGPVAVGETVYLFHRQGEKEILEAASLATGKTQWKREFPALYRASINPDDGPRCTPVVAGKVVVVLGAAGNLHAVDAEDGSVKWSLDLADRFAAPEGYFGVGSTPLVMEDKILVNVGGRDGSGIVAVGLDDGEVKWKSTDFAASYSSPVAAKLNDEPIAVFVTRLDLALVRASDGKLLGSRPFGARGPTVNAATPLVLEDRLFLTASYGVGAALVTLETELETVWANDESLSSQYNTPIEMGGFLYGIHGREDVGVASLRCVELKTGKVQWEEKNYGPAHLIYADGKMISVKADGQVVLWTPNPTNYQRVNQFTATTEVPRAIPALAHGRLLIRASGGRGSVVHCFEVGKTP